MAFSGGGVNGKNPGVRERGIDKAGVEHTRQLHVGGVSSAAGNLGTAVPARERFADEVEIAVDGQNGRLGSRNGALFLVQSVAGNANRHGDDFGGSSGFCSGAEGGIGKRMRGMGRHEILSYALLASWPAASSVAAKTLG